MTLILTNDDVKAALNVRECLDVMEESYREQAASSPRSCHSWIPADGHERTLVRGRYGAGQSMNWASLRSIACPSSTWNTARAAGAS